MWYVARVHRMHEALRPEHHPLFSHLQGQGLYLYGTDNMKNEDRPCERREVSTVSPSVRPPLLNQIDRLCWKEQV